MSKFVVVEEVSEGVVLGIGGPWMRVRTASLIDDGGMPKMLYGKTEQVSITAAAADSIRAMIDSLKVPVKKKVAVDMDEDEAARLGLTAKTG